MPTINKNRIRPSRQKNICNDSFNSVPFYNSLAWKRFRNTYMTEHPICYECCAHKHVEPAEDVHHLHPFSKAMTEEEQWKLFLDPNNVRSLCKKCHHKYHNKMKRYGLDYVDGLTEKEWLEEDE